MVKHYLSEDFPIVLQNLCFLCDIIKAPDIKFVHLLLFMNPRTLLPCIRSHLSFVQRYFFCKQVDREKLMCATPYELFGEEGEGVGEFSRSNNF